MNAIEEILIDLKILLEKLVWKNKKELFAFHKRMTKYKRLYFKFYTIL